jgi:hypothetical protein
MEKEYLFEHRNRPQGSAFPEENIKFSKMKIATCQCGEKMLVVPDLQAMKKAIKMHVSRYACDEKFLTQEVLKVVSN